MMTKDASKGKRLIRAPSDLVSKLNEAAHRQGKTFYSYMSEILEQAARACEMKRSLKEIIDGYEILEVHKEAGTIFTPRDTLNYLIGKVYRGNGETLQQLWYQTGRWYGIYLKEKFDDSVQAFVRLLQEGRWDLNEVTARRNQDTIEFRCISAFLSQERTLLIRDFIEGAMHSLGYKTQEQECFRGIIRLKFSP
jgi:predicted DNA-binding protein